MIVEGIILRVRRGFLRTRRRFYTAASPRTHNILGTHPARSALITCVAAFATRRTHAGVKEAI
jgi:hypothetical protein